MHKCVQMDHDTLVRLEQDQPVQGEGPPSGSIDGFCKPSVHGQLRKETPQISVVPQIRHPHPPPRQSKLPACHRERRATFPAGRANAHFEPRRMFGRNRWNDAE